MVSSTPSQKNIILDALQALSSRRLRCRCCTPPCSLDLFTVSRALLAKKRICRVDSWTWALPALYSPGSRVTSRLDLRDNRKVITNYRNLERYRGAGLQVAMPSKVAIENCQPGDPSVTLC